MNADISGGDVRQRRLEALHVERVLQHLAIRLDENRKTRELRLTVCSRSSALSRCSQSGIRRRGLPRGSSNARAAFILKRAPKSEVEPTSSITSCSASAPERPSSDWTGAHPEVGQAQHDAVVGRLHLKIGVVDRFAHALSERHSPRRVDSAAECGVDHDAHGAVSSLNCSMTMFLSSGTMPVAARCEAMYFTSELAVAASQPYSAASLASFGCFGQLSTQRADAMTEHQSIAPCTRRARTASAPAFPGAGVTTTRSCSIAAILHVDEPS